MVQDPLLVFEFPLAEFQLLHLQFVARHVVFQRHALLLFGIYVGNEFLGERNVALIHLYAVVEFIEVEILPQGEETLLVACLRHGILTHALLEFGESDAGIDGSSGIHHLLCLKSEGVSEMWLRESFYIPEITVGHHHVSVVAQL